MRQRSGRSCQFADRSLESLAGHALGSAASLAGLACHPGASISGPVPHRDCSSESAAVFSDIVFSAEHSSKVQIASFRSFVGIRFNPGTVIDGGNLPCEAMVLERSKILYVL